MLRSNSALNLKFVFSAAIASAMLSACTLPKASPADASKGSNATFYVASADISVTTQKLDPKVSIPVSKTFSFKVCVKDNRLSQTIVNHKFEIKTEGDPIEKFTDAAGCLVWSEDIGYNHLAPAHYLELIRNIRAEGYQKGERSLRFAINPWENQAESLLDKNREDLVPYKDLSMTLQGAASKGSAEFSRPVWVDDLRLTVYEKEMSTQGMVLDFLIRTSPSVVMISNTGDRILQPLTYGEFDTEISLIHVVSENQKQVRRLLTAPIKTKGTMAEGYLSIEAPITLSEVCTRGQVEIGLKLTPKNAPQNLLPFEGVFVGNDCDQIKGSSFNRLTNIFQEAKGKMKIADYLTDQTLPSDDSASLQNTPANSGTAAATSTNSAATSNADYYQAGKILVLPLIINGMGYLDQHTIERVRLFRITACMSGPLDLKALRNQSFHITKVNGGTADVTTNLQGCLYWDDSYKFNFLQSESWKETSIHISNNNLGFDQTLKIHINPWGSTDTTAFRDIRNLDPQGQTLYAAKGRPQIILNTYAYDKAKYDYALDSNLGLTMKKIVNFRLNPRLKRPSLTDPSGYSEEALPIGAYALRWAVVEMSVDDLSQARDKILQADEKLVVMNGNSTIAETLVLQTSELKEIGSTNKLFVELYPLKENAQALLEKNPKLSLDELSDTSLQLPHSVYWGPLTLVNNNEGATLVAYRDTPISIFPGLKKQYAFDQANRLAREQQMARKEKFAADNSLAIVNLNDANTTLTLRKNLTYAQYYSPLQGKFIIRKGSNTTPFADQKLRQWLSTGKMDQDLMAAMCDLFTYEIMYSPNGKKKNVFTANGIANLNELCAFAAKDNTAFEIQYRYFVQNPKLISTQSAEVRDVQVGAGFGFEKGVSNSLSTSSNISLSGHVGLPEIGFIGGGAGAGYSVSKSHSESDGYGSKMTVSTGVSLTMEKVQATIQPESVEKCAMVKLGPAFFENTAQEEKDSVAPGFWQKVEHAIGLTGSLRDFVATTTSDQELTQIMSRGILVCSGAAAKVSQPFVENYYVLNQPISHTTMVDPASDQTRPFFAVLRGDQDMNRFMSFVEASYLNPETGTANDVNQDLVVNKMRGLFSYTPTYPGQIVREH